MEPVVTTTCGKLRGREENGLRVFRGIPFAAPPVGVRRWQPPAPAPSWAGVRDAFAPGAASYQDDLDAFPPSALKPMLVVEEPQDEDCLFLSIWTPALSGSRPVMVWIHGGGFAIGSGSQFIFTGEHLCRRDVVLVTINYRLGPFGFVSLAGPTGGAIPASGNEGLLDQVAALEWVRDNIAGFGGDPNNVTIFGQSAGSISVVSLLSMPAAKGLFHKAIAQSGPGHNLLPIEDALAWLAEPMLEALGARDAKGLLLATPKLLLKALPGFGANVNSGDPQRMNRWARPVIDGRVLPAYPEEAVTGGSSSGIPLLGGATRDELSVLPNSAITEETLLGLVQMGLPESVACQPLINAFRTARESRMARTDPAAILSAISTHKFLMVPTTRLLDAQRVHGPVFQYIFDWASPAGDGATGATHGVDVGFTFGTHAARPAAAAFFGRGPAADALADAVMNAWAAFARNGNPSSQGFGDWPQYDEKTRATMMIGANAHVAERPYEAERRAWDDIPTSAMRNM